MKRKSSMMDEVDPSLIEKMAVKTRLKSDELKRLCDLFGHGRLSLLYKGSVHGFDASAFHSKTDCQGPMVVVAYNTTGYIYGGYTQKGFSSSWAFVKDEKAFLFRSLAWSYRKYPAINPNVAIYNNPNSGPNFGNGSLVFLSSSGKVTTKDTKDYDFKAADLHGNDLSLVELEAFRVKDAGIMESPWRSIDWTTMVFSADDLSFVSARDTLMDCIRKYKPAGQKVPHIRALMIGPVGAGKSSFFNSLNSIFQGHVSMQARAGTDGTSVTKKYRAYRIKDVKGGKSLPLMLCDTMGLDEKPGTGLEIEDVLKILHGHVPNRYQFNTAASINPNTPGYIQSPAFKDKIHIVVFVFNACKVEILSEKLEEKLKQLQAQINELDVPQLVLLTKVDELCPAVAENIENIYRSTAVKGQIHYIATRLGIPVSSVLPVKNYWHELELEEKIDALILFAVQQIIRMAEVYLNDLEEKEEEEQEEEEAEEEEEKKGSEIQEVVMANTLGQLNSNPF